MSQVEAYIGEIRVVGFNYPPEGWAECNGQLLAIREHESLFSLLGTYYGGDGRTTFALPDYRGRAPIHVGEGPDLAQYQQGQKGGSDRSISVKTEVSGVEVINRQPFLASRFIICLHGVYPSRSY